LTNSSPKFTVTLIKSHLPPNFARFIVPISFNKLDLRDYLFHAYNVRTLHIRSSITQGKAFKNNMGQLKRDPPTKYMTAQLLEPFVWPEEPWVKAGIPEEEWDGFDKETHRKTQEAEQNNDVAIKFDKRFRGENSRRLPERKERLSLAEQARRLLDGREKWQGTAAAMGKDEWWRRDNPQEQQERTPPSSSASS
jgi:large subunit ribosomal protein L23